jgi:hypothetical protein
MPEKYLSEIKHIHAVTFVHLRKNSAEGDDKTF